MADDNRHSTYPRNAVAIVGMAGRFPDAADLDQFWRNIHDGKESLETFTESDLDAAGVPPSLRSDPNFVRKGTALPRADLFDASFFGFSPREAQVIDPQQRIFLECAWEAMEHAGYVPQASDDVVVGVYAGASINRRPRLRRRPAGPGPGRHRNGGWWRRRADGTGDAESERDPGRSGEQSGATRKTTVFLQNLDDFAAMNEVYATHVGERPPARSTVEVAKLPSGALVEIEAIAHV